MAFWLLKTEPSAYSFDDLEREGRTRWDGVRNPTALRHIRSTQPGDRCVIYHTGGQRRAVGTAIIVTAPYPDPQEHDARFAVVDVQVAQRLPRPVSLADLKADPLFAGSPLVRISRLSVVPLDAAQFETIRGAGELRS